VTEPALAASQPGRATALRVDSLSKYFGPTRALDRVTMSVRSGCVHALLGGNGSGKSTLIKIVAGVLRAEPGGQITIGGQAHDVTRWEPDLARAAGLRFVHQNPGIFPGLSVAENLAIGATFPRRVTGGIDWPAQRRHTEDVLRHFRISARPGDQVDKLGPATRTMVAIARALQDRREAHDGVLVLDEPTASLPRGEVVMLLDALRHYAELGQTIVFVSHRLDEVLEVADEVTVLRDGQEVVTRTCAGLTKRDLAHYIAGHELRATSARTGLAAVPGTPRVQTTGLAAGPLAGVDLDLQPGQVLGVAGLLGSGRTTLLRALFGLIPIAAGTVRIDGTPVVLRNPQAAVRRGLAYVPEDRKAAAAFATLSVQSNLSVTRIGDYWHRGRFRHAAEARDARSAIESFGVRCESERALITTLSGGNQQKAMLARWLQLQPRILLLDEPTQGVDVHARAEIFRLIHRAVADGASALVVSSDFDELIEVCDEIAVLSAGRVADRFPAGSVTAGQLLESAFGRDGAA
jgi:ribose transport system ATP-binding protein